MARLYRVTRYNPPELTDFQSYWDLGRRPRKQTPAVVARFRRVSTFDSLEVAVDAATAGGLGEFVAELLVPDAVARETNTETGHVGLEGTSPEQLRSYVVQMHQLGDNLSQ